MNGGDGGSDFGVGWVRAGGPEKDGEGLSRNYWGKSGNGWEKHPGGGKGSWKQNKYWVMHEPNRDREEKPLDTKPMQSVKKAEVVGKKTERVVRNTGGGKGTWKQEKY